MKYKVYRVIAALLMMIGSVPALATTVIEAVAEAEKVEQAELKEIAWESLTPPPDPEVVTRYQEGKMSDKEVDEYVQELGEQSVIKVDNTYGKMPGYLVPLNLNENQIATEMLLVPAPGSCIHVPPPPPNQIVHITYPKGIKLTDQAYIPFWVTGKLEVKTTTSKYSDALYSISVDSIEEYNFNDR